MAMPKFNKPEGMLDSIKSKLGFSDGGDYYDRGRKDYDDYDSSDYDDYDDDYEEDDAAPSSNYDPYDSVTTRPARGNHARTSVGSGGYRPAKLVSIDDVRAHTTVPDSLNRDPLPPRKVSSASFGNRTMVDPAFTAPANTPNARAAAAANQERSESLNALFSTTAAEAAESSAAPAAQTAAKPIEGAFTAEMFLSELQAALASADDADLILPQAESTMHLVELLEVIGGSFKSPAALALVYGEEAECAENGLDWSRAEEAYGQGADDDDDYGYDDEEDDCGCGHHHDHGGFGYSAN